MKHSEPRYTHVHYAWNDAHVSQLSPLESLVYRSNRLGEDRRIANTSDGSTSLKVMEKDPGSGQSVEVIWIKNTGADLCASTDAHFSPLYQEKLVALGDRHHNATATPNTPLAERIKTAAFRRTMSSPSTDTPLHALMPYAHVSHLHPSSAIAVGACRNSRSLTEKIWGKDMLWIPRKRPGVEQGIKLQEAWSQQPSAKGALLVGNGVATWSDDNKSCYQQVLDITEAASHYIAERDLGERTFGGPLYQVADAANRAERFAKMLPALTELVSDRGTLAAHLTHDSPVMRFIHSVDAPRLASKGVASAHHLSRVKLKPLYIPWDPNGEPLEILEQRMEQEVERYRQRYRTYYETQRAEFSKGEPVPLDSTAPAICLIPGVGMIAWGRNEREARIASESYKSAIEVMRCAEAIDTYVGLPEAEAFAIQYGSDSS